MATINPEKAAQVVALIEDSKNQKYVAEVLDLSVSTVQQLLMQDTQTPILFREDLIRDALDVTMTTGLLF